MIQTVSVMSQHEDISPLVATTHKYCINQKQETGVNVYQVGIGLDVEIFDFALSY